jgi:hypothetical protein
VLPGGTKGDSALADEQKNSPGRGPGLLNDTLSLPPAHHFKFRAAPAVDPDAVAIKPVAPVQFASGITALAGQLNPAVRPDVAIIAAHIVGSAVNNRACSSSGTTVPAVPAPCNNFEVATAAAINPQLISASPKGSSFFTARVASLSQQPHAAIRAHIAVIASHVIRTAADISVVTVPRTAVIPTTSRGKHRELCTASTIHPDLVPVCSPGAALNTAGVAPLALQSHPAVWAHLAVMTAHVVRGAVHALGFGTVLRINTARHRDQK